VGDRGEAIPNRYTYTIAYEFRLPNGQMAQGHTQRVGDFFAPRDMAVGKPVRVRYLPGAPWLNEIPAAHWAAGLERAIVTVVGAGLVALAFGNPRPCPAQAVDHAVLDEPCRFNVTLTSGDIAGEDAIQGGRMRLGKYIVRALACGVLAIGGLGTCLPRRSRLLGTTGLRRCGG
jgi:hypothetical protein